MVISSFKNPPFAAAPRRYDIDPAPLAEYAEGFVGIEQRRGFDDYPRGCRFEQRQHGDHIRGAIFQTHQFTACIAPAVGVYIYKVGFPVACRELRDKLF